MKLSDLLFACWLIVLPFYEVSLVGGYSLDNMAAPILGVVGLLGALLFGGEAKRQRGLWIVLLLCVMYTMLNVMGTVVEGNVEQFASALRLELRVMLYFLIPIVFISNITQFRRALTLFTFGSVLVSLSAVAAGLGLLPGDFAAHETRFDIGVQRSLGLAGGSGPFAVWTLVALLTTMSASRWEGRHFLRHRMVRWAVYAMLALGVLAAQSRNVILVVIMTMVLLPVIRWLGGRENRYLVPVMIVAAPLAVALLIFTPLILSYAYDAFATIGGEGTMRGRLDQYRMAWTLITAHPFGLTGDLREKYEALVIGIHSIWLGVLLKGGMPSLAALLLILGRAFFGSWRKLRSTVNTTEAAAVVVMSIVLPVSGSFFVAQHHLIFWVCMAIPFAYQGLVDDKVEALQGAPAPSIPRNALPLPVRNSGSRLGMPGKAAK